MTKRTIEQILDELRKGDVHYWRTNRPNQTQAGMIARDARIRRLSHPPERPGSLDDVRLYGRTKSEAVARC